MEGFKVRNSAPGGCPALKEKAPRQWPIFPLRRRSSIVSAGAFHFRVRDGNGWVRTAQTAKGLTSIIMHVYEELFKGLLGCTLRRRRKP